MTIDKQNGDVAYADETHSYWNVNDNEKYISVTTLIHLFSAPFDKEFWSAYKALERIMDPEVWKIERKTLLGVKKINKSFLSSHNIDENEFNKVQQSILDDWDKENRDACERGTKIHAEIEKSMYDMGANVSLRKFGIGGKFVCQKSYGNLDAECGVYPEYLISRTSEDGILRIAGQIDLLVKNGNEITIVDYKGLPLDTEIPTVKGWSTMGDLSEGDIIFDKDGNTCKVIHKSKIHYNPCYKITFSKDFSIIADEDHNWLVSFSTHPHDKIYHGGLKTKVMTTLELKKYLETYNKKNQYQVPKIYINNKLNLKELILPIDPYVLGLWLGDGCKANGRITLQLNSKVWDEVEKRGYELSENLEYRENVKAETRNVYGLMHQLREQGLLNNKHIPEIYQRGSFKLRLELLQGLMDADGFYDKTHSTYVMSTNYEWQKDGMIKLLSSMGIKCSVNYVNRPGYIDHRMCWDIKFKTDEFNAFLTRNNNCIITKLHPLSYYYSIKSIEKTETIPTQCIEVDSVSHTYLCTNHMLVTHNTNKKIELKAGYNAVTKSTNKMYYPLNNLDDVNYWHYTMQLSTYAWMIQKLNPEFIIKDLILVHFDHKGNQTIYHLDYLKDEVERMLLYHRKNVIRQRLKDSRKRIEY